MAIGKYLPAALLLTALLACLPATAIAVEKKSQAITFTSTAPSNATIGGATYTVTATGGGSGNPVAFTIDAASKSVCTISGSTVSFTGAGTCTVDANQAGNSTYEAAPQKQQSFAVVKKSSDDHVQIDAAEQRDRRRSDVRRQRFRVLGTPRSALVRDANCLHNVGLDRQFHRGGNVRG